MSVSSTFGAIDKTGWLIIGIAGVIVLYEVVQALDGGGCNGSPGALGRALGIPDPTDTTGDPNSLGDTSSSAYAGAGIFGWLGNIFNKASGGVLQSAGNAIGSGLANVGCSYSSASGN